jgi:hypothetical protein
LFGLLGLRFAAEGAGGGVSPSAIFVETFFLLLMVVPWVSLNCKNGKWRGVSASFEEIPPFSFSLRRKSGKH